MTLDDWREAVFLLCWRQHGGSGLGLSMEEALDLTTQDRDWYLERIGKQRDAEAKAIAKAGKR